MTAPPPATPNPSHRHPQPSPPPAVADLGDGFSSSHPASKKGTVLLCCKPTK